ncbi:MAG: response regulator [Phenylobacterium sp.]|nr:response regulator [Phenylobacterium sp.]
MTVGESPSLTDSAADPRAVSLRARLVLLVLAVLIPALLAAGLLLWNAYRQEEESLSRQMSVTARALALVVDRQLGQEQVLLDSLATSPTLAAGDWKGFDAQARAATRHGPSWIVVLNPQGDQVVNTMAPAGATLPTRAQRQTSSTFTRPRSAQVRVSNLFNGTLVGSPIIALDREVTLADGRRVTLASSAFNTQFDRVWRDQDFPAEWTGSIVDARGVIVSRNRQSARFVGTSASAPMLARMAHAASGVAHTRTLDGVPSLTAWSRSPTHGWSFVVAVPQSEVLGAARRSMFWAVLLGLGFLGVGVALAGLSARALVRPVEALAQAARTWAAGGEPHTLPSGTVEIDALTEVLNDSITEVQRHRRELQELNASLEVRVAERTRELAEATENLAQVQKMEAIGRLTGGVAHDFNNLLMAVLGNLDLLAKRLTDPRQLKYVEQARAAGERGAKLTGQLLAFARRQRLEARAIDAAAAVEAAGALLTSTLGASHQVAYDLAPGLWPALGDVTQVELMVVNLAINARDAMPGGGIITISAQNTNFEPSASRGEAPAAGEYVVISVADTGEGMAAEVAARAFEPFFTTKAIGKGSGLGLPQVLGLAKQLGGGVEIDTVPGQGTMVRVYLPRAEAIGAAEAPVRLPTAGLTGLRVLLVDDDTDVRTVAEQILADMGCVVTSAASGEAGLAQLAADPGLQAALVDFAMPGLNGGETAQRIWAQRPGLPIVVMSGYADLDQLADAWTGPVLHKPFTTAALAEQLARAANGAASETLR